MQRPVPDRTAQRVSMLGPTMADIDARAMAVDAHGRTGEARDRRNWAAKTPLIARLHVR